MPVIFPSNEIVTLGFIIYPLGVELDSDSLRAINFDWPFDHYAILVQNVPHVFDVVLRIRKNELVIDDCQIFLIRRIEDDERVGSPIVS
jgi:hypothetical protein